MILDKFLQNAIKLQKGLIYMGLYAFLTLTEAFKMRSTELGRS